MKNKTTLVALALLSSLSLVSAQERLSREETLKYAMVAALDLKQLMGTPIPTDVDVKQAVALRDGEFGGMILPEAKLTADQIAAAKTDVVPVGQLWLYNLTPMKDGNAVDSDALRLATVSSEGNEVKLPQCALGVRRTGSGALELVVYGKGKEPVAATPLKALDGQSAKPGIEVEAERDSSSGRIILTLVGKYKAIIEVTQLSL